MHITLARRRLLTLALAAGAAPAFIRHALAADVRRFALGIASGQPHAQGMVLWTRLGGNDLPAEVSVTWQVAEDEAFTRVVQRGTETARVDDAHSVHAEPMGLQPARWYWYRFEALGQRSMAGRTRTAPAADAEVRQFDFAIASCQRYDVGHYAAWRHAADEQLDAVLFLGDYIYEYNAGNSSVRPTYTAAGTSLRTLADYRQRYALTKSDPALQAAHAATPWLLVWDDHEVENDYAGLQGNRLQPDFAAQRAAAYKAYWEHLPLPKAARPVDGAMRMFGRLDWGDLARIHLLDDRQMRDPQACQQAGRGGSSTVRRAECAALADPHRTLLGAAQERWLADGWSTGRPWNLLAQQTLMARSNTAALLARKVDQDTAASAADGAAASTTASTLASTSASTSASKAASTADSGSVSEDPMVWTDGWDGYPAARDRLLKTVADKRVPGVVVLGGDVHANFVADLRADQDRPADQRAPIVASEFCGTSISSLGGAQRHLDGVRPHNPHWHWARSDQRGYMRFVLTRSELQASLRVVDDARNADSGIGTAARFVVPAGKPGVQPG